MLNHLFKAGKKFFKGQAFGRECYKKQARCGKVVANLRFLASVLTSEN
jgi:hypothetical protein